MAPINHCTSIWRQINWSDLQKSSDAAQFEANALFSCHLGLWKGQGRIRQSPLKLAKKKWKNMCVVNLTLTQRLLGWIEVWQTNNTKCWSETSILYITIQVFIKETSFTKSESITTWHQDKREVTEHGGCSKAIQPPMTATIAKVSLVWLRMNGCLFGHPTNPECLSYAPSPSPNQTVLISYLKGLLAFIYTPLTVAGENHPSRPRSWLCWVE